METREIWSRDVEGARGEILEYIRDYRDKKVIYFDGWSGFGAVPVLRSIAQALPLIKAKETPPELCYDKIIYIDCSEWISRREMQRKIAEELELDHETIMAMFHKQDEEDDFNGVDHSSRDVIRRVSQAIDRTLGYRKFMMIFLNGSDDEVDVRSFGINPDSRDNVIVWTFKRRSLTMHHRRAQVEIRGNLRCTHLYFASNWQIGELTTLEFSALLREEAAIMVARNSCMRNIGLRMVTDCCLYALFLHYCFYRATRFYWQLNHAPNYWLCDGIIKGDITREISIVLRQEICWECDASLLEAMYEKLKEDPEAPFSVFEEDIADGKRPFRWISVNSENLEIQEHMQTIFEKASTLIVAFEMSDGLPNGLFKHCSNLGVLTLSCCAFSFVSPPFLHCPNLRFLGLDQCTNDNASEGDDSINWAYLRSLWVLDIRYTDWDDILTEEKMDLMTNLRELNIEGICCWQYTSRLQGRLSYLQRLRIIKPTHQEETSSINSTNNSFIDKTKLEILDLSGNSDMKNLPASLSKASSLQVLILDGCDGLENVVVPDSLPSSLRSFSFDGHGSASHWESTVELPEEWSRPECSPDTNKKDIVKISKISLEGCSQLENLFVRGLPNLVELDLSGTSIKVLDFGTMVVNVPGLKRLFLLGCEHLRAIRWGPDGSTELDLLCLDTRSRWAPGFTRPSLAQHGSFGLQLHAILADARLARSLWRLVDQQGCAYFNIHVTSSSTEYGGVVQLEGTKKEMIGPSNQMHHVRTSRYGDVYTKIGDALMLAFPQPPTQQLDHHIEISDGSRGIESELEYSSQINYSLATIMVWYAESLHVHDASTSASMPATYFQRLRWCRVERCPNMDTVFPSGAGEHNDLETIWASDLQMARCIWSKGSRPFQSFGNLQHLHLRSCPRLQYVLPVWVSSFPSLKTLHIIHCGDLMHVFVLDGRYPEEIAVNGVPFPKLTTIHLHDLPKLRQISEIKMRAPALETIKIRGCFGLRRLPAVAGREPGTKKPAVEIEKDVWDKLEWDGLAAGHHPDLFEPPVHSRYYRRRHLRGTVLR